MWLKNYLLFFNNNILLIYFIITNKNININKKLIYNNYVQYIKNIINYNLYIYIYIL